MNKVTLSVLAMSLIFCAFQAFAGQPDAKLHNTTNIPAGISTLKPPLSLNNDKISQSPTCSPPGVQCYCEASVGVYYCWDYARCYYYAASKC